MVGASSLQPRIISSFVGSRFILSTQPLNQLFGYNSGRNRVSMQMSRRFSGLTNLLFNRRNLDEEPNRKRKRLRPGKVSPHRPVPDHIPRPHYVNSRQPIGIVSGPEVHDEKGIECMRASGRLAAQVLEYAGTFVKPGVKTDEIDEAVHQMIIDNGAYPSPLGYGGFPKSVCTSVNECICHGIPDSHALEDGDIINIDVTVYLNGYHGDTSATFFCGDVDDEARNLVKVTKECLHKAISVCAPGVEYKKIGKTIHDHADKYNYGVVRQFVGHGIGCVFHADPVVLHYSNYPVLSLSCTCFWSRISMSSMHSFTGLVAMLCVLFVGWPWYCPSYQPVMLYFLEIDKDLPVVGNFIKLRGNNDRGRMVLNQTFTIEPMLTIGSINPVMWDDNWTVVTEDGSLSAQFEHTILITPDGAEILTQC